MIQKSIIAVLVLICTFLAYTHFIEEKGKEDQVLEQMILKNKAVKDSLSSIIARLHLKDSILNHQRDSLQFQLKLVKGLSSKIQPKLDAINKKVNENLLNWESLSDIQKDSVIKLVIIKYQ